ncbi:MAG: phosphatidate cytidylyltransferase [Candidatus Omnitrophota bacterium]|nr:MAG: phosphatidate cytidylyltransferase [Candidatus Omnitrophota bacterium]
MADNIFKRIVTSLGIVFVAGIIIFLFPDWAFCLLVVLFIGFSLYEFFSTVEKRDLFVYKYFGIVAGTIIPIAIYLHLGEGHANLEPFFIVIACLFTFVLQFARKENTNDHLVSIAVTLFALFYISWFFSFFIKIKYLPYGARLVSFLIIVTKMGDIGAYFVGNKFGKNPLISRISPRKTKEGAFGGLVFSVVSAVLCKLFLIDFSYYHAVLLGFLLGIIGQVGDLAESLFKRDFAVKDSGKRLPGLGGVLDVIDSLLFTAPIFYFYIKILLSPS